MVGNKRLQGWMTKLAKLFMRAGVRYFDDSRLDDARAWVRLGASN